MPVCTLSNTALTFEEKKKLQVWLKRHESKCPGIQSMCEYTLLFSTGRTPQVHAKCKNCEEKQKL